MALFLFRPIRDRTRTNEDTETSKMEQLQAVQGDAGQPADLGASNAALQASAPVNSNTQGDSLNPSGDSTNPSENLGGGTQQAQAIPYERFRETIGERNTLRSENEQLKSQLTEYQQSLKYMAQNPTFANQVFGQIQTQVDPQVQGAIETLRSAGFKSADEIRSEIKEELQREKMVEKLDNQFKTLEKQYDGKDGRPKFDPVQIGEFMRDSGIMQPEYAYRIIHLDKLADWQAEQSRMNKPKGTYTERTGGQGAQSGGKDRNAALQAAQKSGNIKGFLRQFAVPDTL